MKRRHFVQQGSQAGLALSLVGLAACKQKKTKEPQKVEKDMNEEEVPPFFKLSLAQWSIHRMIREDGLDPYRFAELAKKWGFTGIEYVNQLYNKELEAAKYSDSAMANFVDKCNAEAKRNGLQNVLIMIDGEGGMAVPKAADRKQTVENHYKWVEAAQAMGCGAIRVNLYGSDDPKIWKEASVDSLTQLSTYAKDKNINVVVENHGGLSSNGAMVADVMKTVNLPNCGTLPDFGNFCITRGDSGCADMYDIYKGVTEMMPYAKAVSAKSHDFDAQGNETEIDYAKMLQIVKEAGYAGFIGVEYEGGGLSEEAGILATKELMLKAAKTLG
ncbi:MAG: sugar phosphate isomerase/epimerase family protein [Bacteroidota bacterium]